MRLPLTIVAVPLFAGAVVAQNPFFLPCVGSAETVRPVTATRAISGERTSPANELAMPLPELGGDHPIAPPVPPPAMIGKAQRSGSGDTPTPTTPSGPTAPSAPSPSGPSAGAAGTGAATPAGRAPAGPRTGRGMSLDQLETTTWSHWWAWNRGAFELPVPRDVKEVRPGTTAVPVDPRPRQALVAMCRSPHVSVRVAAVQALGRVGASVDELQPFLEDAAREVRLTTLLALGSGGTAAHARVLAGWLAPTGQGETIVAALAGFSLLEDGPARRMLAPTVAALLVDERLEVQAAAALAIAVHDTETRRAAAQKLLGDAQTGSDRAFAAQVLTGATDKPDLALLGDLVATRNIDTRRSAAMALGRTRDANALRVLCDALAKERDQSTRSSLLMALGDHRGDGAEVVLLRELENGPKALRCWAALALGMWGRGRDNTAALARAIDTALAAEKNRDQKGAYLLALGLLRHEGARDLLVASLDSEEETSTRGAAAVALGMLGGDAALAPLAQSLASDSCPGARQQAARALEFVGAKALDTLIGALRTEKDAHVRTSLLWSLGGIENVRSTTALLASAADEAEPVEARAAAALALGRAFRKHEPRLPDLRFQHDDLLPPPIVAWAFGQEL